MYRWTCLDDLMNLCHQPHYQDVTIICKNGHLNVNSFLLASLFPVLRNILVEDSKVIMKDTCLEELENLLKFFHVKHPQKILLDKSLVGLLQITKKSDYQDFSEENEERDYLDEDNIDIDETNLKEETYDSDDDVKERKKTVKEDNPKVIPIVGNLLSKGKLVKCNKCGKVMKLQRSLERHLALGRCVRKKWIKTGPKKPVKVICNICGKSLKRTSLKAHIDKRHTEDSNTHEKCSTCGIAVKKSEMENHTCTLYTCDTCEKQFNHHYSFKVHLESHMKPQPVKKPQDLSCKDCGQVFETKHKRNYHMLSVHKEADTECKICGKSLAGEASIKRHMKVFHTDSSLERCKTCGKFYKKWEADSHTCIFHTCDKCGLSFTCIKKFRLHNNREHSENPFTCEHCGKVFIKYNLYVNHIDNEHKEKKFACEQCGKRFRLISRLQVHQRVHGEKSVCPICNMNVRSLKRHIQSHHTAEEDKRFPCSKCGKGFVDKTTLKQHDLAVHLKLKPWLCRFDCNYSCASKTNLYKHERMVHGKVFEQS